MADGDRPSPLQLERLRVALARARRSGRGYADALLSDPAAAKLVPSLPVQELYYAIREVGLGDAHEILSLASPDQVRGFVDLAAWKHSDFLPEQAAEWIDALIDLGPEKLASSVEALDPEVVALFLQKQAVVYDLTLEQPPDEPQGHYYPTPDRFYLIDILPADVESGKRIERFLDWLYRADLDLGRRVVMSAKWELTAELEEFAFRWRSGRMADLGFVDFYEALEVYRWLDPATVKVGEGSADDVPMDARSVPGLVATVGDGTFLERALATIEEPDELSRLQVALFTLGNTVMAADDVDPGDAAGARAALERIAAYLGIGLELLGRGDPRLAGDALRTVALQRIFRVGVSVTLKLKQAAETLAARSWVSLVPRATSLLDGDLRAAVAALRGKRPTRAGGQPFRTLADVAEATLLLEEAALLGTTVQRGLGVDPARLGEGPLAGVSPPRESITFSTVVATLLANALLDRPPALVPLAPSDLAPLRALAIDPATGKLRPAVGARGRQVLSDRLVERREPPPRAWDRWLDGWVAHLERTLTPATVGSAGADPREVTGLLLRVEAPRPS